MSTPKLDSIAVSFVRRIPDDYKSPFSPLAGVAMPDANTMTKDVIMDYVNRGLLKLFNMYWAGSGGNTKKFLSILPELRKTSGELTLTDGNYTIANPHKDFYKLVGAIKGSEDNFTFIKIWDDSKYTIAKSGEYEELTPTEANPAIIQVSQVLAVFPQDSEFKIIIDYIKTPLDPVTGLPLTQNGTYDSPFNEHWIEMITDQAYEIYLQESYQTT